MNSQRTEAFQQKMVTLLNQGALNLAVAIGYRTGLFEAMAEIGRPATIGTISAKSGGDRRYVREWLAVMAAGGIVELVGKSGDGERYHLPPEHAACLVREAGNRNLAVYSQEIPILTISAMSDLASNLDHPMAPFLYTVSLLHCLPVGRYRGGEGLGMMWGRKKAVTYLEQAGFSQVEVIEMSHDAFNYHYLCRK